MDNDLKEKLEFAAREYKEATLYLITTLSQVEEIPVRIYKALEDLVNAINEEWK